jgi:hypothetical protein
MFGWFNWAANIAASRGLDGVPVKVSLTKSVYLS